MNMNEGTVIIWLDSYIGVSDHCLTLKNAFSSTLDPKWSPPAHSDSTSIDNLIKSDFSKNSYSHKSNAIELYAFSKEQTAAQCFQDNKGKRLFVIVSGSLAESFVPKIIRNCPQAFEKCGNGGSSLVYVFCASISQAREWAMDYSDYVQMFNDESDLLTHLIHDVGNHFFSLGQKQYVYKTSTSIHRSLKYLNWAKTLCTRAIEIGKTKTYNTLEQDINSQIEAAKALLQQLTNNSDDDNRSDIEMHESSQPDELNVSFSSCASVETNTEANCVVSESEAAISSDDIDEKRPIQTKKTAADRKHTLHIQVCLLLPSPITKDFKDINLILEELFGEKLLVVSNARDFLKAFENEKLLATILPPPIADNELLLDKIFTLNSPPSIYLLGKQPNSINEKQAFFTKYFRICAMVDDPRELATKVALDVALKSRMMGDRYAKNKDEHRANKMYDQCIGLLNRLKVLALKKQG